MKYNLGTITVANGSPNVVGTGTKWVANVAAGQLLTVVGSGVTYQIASVTDDTHLVLASNYVVISGNTDLSYTIIQGFTTGVGIPYPDIGDVQTATILKRSMIQIDVLFNDYLSGRISGQSVDATGPVTLIRGANSVANKTGTVLVLTLPAGPSNGDHVSLTDAYRSTGGTTDAATNNWHIFPDSPSTEHFENGASYLTLSVAAGRMRLRFNSTRQLWELW